MSNNDESALISSLVVSALAAASFYLFWKYKTFRECREGVLNPVRPSENERQPVAVATPASVNPSRIAPVAYAYELSTSQPPAEDSHTPQAALNHLL